MDVRVHSTGRPRRSVLGPLAALVLACGAASVHAQDPGDVIEVSAVVAPATVAPGERAQLAVTVTISAGWHVNAHVPSEPYLIPTALSLTTPPEIEVGEVRYPAGELRAVGAVLSDQIPYMRRVGFDTFAVTHGPTRRALAEGRIPEVTLYYQPATADEPPAGTRPWLRRGQAPRPGEVRG